MSFKIALFFIPALIFFAGCVQDKTEKSPDSAYRVLLLGDLHFDRPEYHSKPAPSPKAAQERKCYLAMWKNGASERLLSIAAKSVKQDMPFVIQLGDLIQGDTDDDAAHCAAFTDAVGMIKKYIPDKTLLLIKGNHDIRGGSGRDGNAVRNVFPSLIGKELGKTPSSGANYVVRQGKDLFIAYDHYVSGSSKHIRKALAENSGCRYVFLLTHPPFFPCMKTGFPGVLYPEYKELLELFKKHNVIILAAHIHMFSHIAHKDADGEVRQVTVTSIGHENWDKKDAFRSLRFGSYQELLSQIRPVFFTVPETVAGLNFFKNVDFATYKVWRTPRYGFGVLDISDTGVRLHFHVDNSGIPAETVTLR